MQLVVSWLSMVVGQNIHMWFGLFGCGHVIAGQLGRQDLSGDGPIQFTGFGNILLVQQHALYKLQLVQLPNIILSM